MFPAHDQQNEERNMQVMNPHKGLGVRHVSAYIVNSSPEVVGDREIYLHFHISAKIKRFMNDAFPPLQAHREYQVLPDISVWTVFRGSSMTLLSL